MEAIAGVTAVLSFVTEMTKGVGLIGRKLDYLLRSRKYVNKMNNQVEPLVNNQVNLLQNAVAVAQGFGKEIKPDVEQWLISVDVIIARANEIRLMDSNRRCFHGWCVDFESRYNINKSAVEICGQISRLIDRAPDSTAVALPTPPATVVPDYDFMEFQSTNATMLQIMEALKDAECGVVGIFGMGGIGKTTIVKQIADMVKNDKQFDKVAMAVVSQSPDLKKIQGQIASMLGLKFDQEAEVEGRASQLHRRLMQLSILVILDDVWARLDLARIGIPTFSKNNRCKVLLATRSKDICASMGPRNKNKIIEVGILSEQESWNFFKRIAGEDDIEASPDLEQVAVDVMKKCHGLPVALKTVGSALRGKRISDWEDAKLKLGRSETANIDMTKEVISCLRLSYDYLESDEMKGCFLICCLFPEDAEIPIELLVRYAVGKELFRYAGKIDQARKSTKRTVENLILSSLLLRGDEHGEEIVKVHDVVRDVGLRIAFEANILSGSGPDLGPWLHSNSSIQGASFFATEEVVLLPEEVQCPELEELILHGSQLVYSEAFFGTMTRLKVLIHQGYSQLPASLTCSVSLMTLHLMRCELGDVSAALGELKKLKILTINETDIESLPVEVGKLTSLRLLDLMRNRRLRSIPGNVISQLCQLEELYIGKSFKDWEIETTSTGTGGYAPRASLSELQKLPRLAILSIQIREFAQMPPNFHLPNKLVKFEICVGTFDGDFHHYPRSPALKLGDAEFQLEGVQSLLHLVDGKAGGHDSNRKQFAAAAGESRNRKYVLTALAGGCGLNELTSLEIVNNSWITALTIYDDKAVPVFENLKELSLVAVNSLRGLGSRAGVLPRGSLQQLKVLKIHKCPALEGWAVPCIWTHRLCHLETVTVSECAKVTGVFEVEEENNTNASSTLPLFSKLREIVLFNLPELRSLSNVESSVIRLSNLRVVRIYDCHSLVYVFARNVISQSLEHLQTLDISDCSHLEAMFEETTTSIALPDLKDVSVDGCTQLKSLFTVSMAKGLLKLQELDLRHNNNHLEEIVSCDKNRAPPAADENTEIIEAESSSIISINWPQMRRINLIGSRQLKRFCPGNCRIEMPLLRKFSLSGFDSNWMNTLAVNPAAHGLKIPQRENIYWETEVPNTSEARRARN